MNIAAVTMPRMELATITLVCAYGLAGLLVDDALGVLCDRPAVVDWAPAWVLDRVLKVALEIPD